MSKELKISHHAIYKYYVRSSIDPIGAYQALQDDLATANEKSLEEVRDMGFNIPKPKGVQHYLVWYNTNVKQEMVAIVRDNLVLTVLTKDFAKFKGMKFNTGNLYNRGGHR